MFDRSHRVLISASNEISTLEVVCHVIVKPRVVGHIPVDLTASYNMQLEAVVRSDSGLCLFIPYLLV